MDKIILITKFLIFSLVGYYVLNIILKDKCIFKGMTNPFYGFFGMSITLFKELRIPLLFVIGILLGLTLNILFGLVDKRLKTQAKLNIYGLLALIHIYIIDPLINIFLGASDMFSVTFLFTFLGILFLIDISYSLRKLL